MNFNPLNILQWGENIPLIGGILDTLNASWGIDPTNAQEGEMKAFDKASKTYGALRDPYQQALMNTLQQKLAVTQGQNQLLGEMGGHPIDYGALLKNPWANTGLKR